MRKLRRIIFWFLSSVSLAVVLIVAAGILWLWSSLPVTSGSVTVTGLTAPAVITRDENGLVHIRAADALDAYFALGYAHAQDRLWQMEANRRTAAGRLSEIGGARFLRHDRMMRVLGLSRLAQESLQSLAPETRRVLNAYAAGVNAWLGAHGGALPPEFELFRIRPEPWTPKDSLVWGRMMAMSLSSNWRREILRTRINANLPEARPRAESMAALFPPYPVNGPVTVPGWDRKAAAMPAPAPRRDPTTDKTLAPLFAALDAALPAPPVATSASNAWAVAGGRTASGKPILANDPHLGLKTPNVWYLARIEAPGLTLAGATAPGVPFHVLGHNGRIAWGMTTTGADTQDLYIETVDPADPGRYLTPSGPRRFSTRQETITVAGAAPVTITVRETRHGPVISDVAGDTAALTAPGKVIALAATALRADDRTAEALYRINLARDWSAFIDALTRFDSPVQNFTYADVEGHIGFATAGRIPVRRAGDGRMPVPGASAAFDWIGMIPRRELPTVVDPPGGTLINANNRVVGPGYPWLLTMDWGPSHRASRIEAVITATNPHDSAAARALQGDVVSLVARELLPLMLRQTAAAPTTARARALLAAWDGTVGRERPEPLIFTAWLRALNRALFADELGPAFARYQGLRPSVIAGVLGSGGSWCDDITTSATETCPAMLARALSEALAELRTDHGDDPALWRWGTAHVAKFRNRALDWIPLIGRATRIPIATGGDDFTVNRGTTRIRSHIAPYAHVHGPTLRAIYDLADLDRSQFIQPGGQSGNPFSAHYRDLTTRWRDGKYLTLPASPAGKTRGLRLVPAQVP